MSDLEALLNDSSPEQTTSQHSPQSRQLSASSSRPSTPSTPVSEDALALLTINHAAQMATSQVGVEVLTWRDCRQKLIRALPSHHLAKDLPHTFEDNMNAMPVEFRSLFSMRKLFEAMIIENTARDEPDAPPIRIFNEEDDDPHPEWEFHYTNQMWYGEGVPGPELTDLVGCDCEGKCRPNLRPCKCSERQHSFYPEMEEDFIYDRQGILIYHNVYIHECNNLCSCDETCPNRVRDTAELCRTRLDILGQVVQHGRRCEVNIVKTKHKGWGVFLLLVL
jgi:histone-lysine N-methyltransferase SUV39H